MSMTTEEANNKAWAWYFERYGQYGVRDTPEDRAIVEKESLAYSLKTIEIILLEPVERFVDWLERQLERI